MHPSFIEYKMPLLTIYIQYLTSTFMYLFKLCIVVKYALFKSEDFLATIGLTLVCSAAFPRTPSLWRAESHVLSEATVRRYCENKICLLLLLTLIFV